MSHAIDTHHPTDHAPAGRRPYRTLLGRLIWGIRTGLDVPTKTVTNAGTVWVGRHPTTIPAAIAGTYIAETTALAMLQTAILDLAPLHSATCAFFTVTLLRVKVNVDELDDARIARLLTAHAMIAATVAMAASVWAWGVS